MKNITIYHIGALAGAFVLSLMFLSFLTPIQTIGQGIGGNTPDCEQSTSTKMILGNGGSTQILASHGRRAWAIVQQPMNATNTVTLSFGSTAVAGFGPQLSTASSSDLGQVNDMSFGLATELPYTGAVSAISDQASTTVIVTECRY